MFACAKPEQKQASKSTVQKKEPEKIVSSSNVTGIPDTMKSRFENLSGFSFDDVRVHYNSDKPAQFQALAFAQGNQVYIGSGQEKHLAHELGHVVQQKQGRVRPTMQQNGIAVNDDTTLEHEADMFLTHVQTQTQAVPQKTKVVQRVLTRSGYVKLLNDISANRHLGPSQIATILRERNYEEFDIRRAFDELGIYSEPVDEVGDPETEDAYHAQDADSPETPCTPDDIDDVSLRREMFPPSPPSPFFSTQFMPAQFRRAGNKASAPKTFDSSISGRYTSVVYTTDARGGINFARPTSFAARPASPVSGAVVKLNQGSKNKDKGIMKSGNLVDIRTASREQHFSIANRITKNGYSGQSPPDLTWHHLLKYPEMVLVDRTVHSKYGHNGGYLLW